MAVTKIHPIKSTLKKALDYIENPAKTDEKMLVSSFACSYETADIEFELLLSQAMQKGKGHADQGNAAARDQLLHALALAAGVILSIALQQVDAAPDTQGTAQTDHDGLQSIDCAVEKFHKVLTFCRLFCGTQKFFQKMPPHSAAASSSDRSISYRSKLSSCATTCCRFRRRVDKNLSTSKVFFLSASARYL